MNIIEILWKLGYKVISFNEGLYKIKLTDSKKDKLRKNYDCLVDDYEEVRTISIGSVGFNCYGDLYVEFLEENNFFDKYNG